MIEPAWTILSGVGGRGGVLGDIKGDALRDRAIPEDIDTNES